MSETAQVTVEIGAMYGLDHGAAGGRPPSPATFAAAAEAVGFDAVWTGDHLLPYVDGIASVAAMAAATERVTVGTNVLLMPLRPAAVTAKGMLTTALVAGARRTVMGVGVGGEVDAEFGMVGVARRGRGARTDASLRTIQELWTARDRGSMMMDPPVERLPEIFVGGRSDAAVRRAVEFGTGYSPYLVDPEQARQRYRHIDELAAEAGRSIEGFTYAATTFMVSGASVEAAVRAAMAFSGLQGMTEERVRRFYLLGTPAEMATQAEAFVAAGTNHLVLGWLPDIPGNGPMESYMESAAELLRLLRAGR